MCNWILRVETEHSIRRQAETRRLGAKVDGTVGCDKEAACQQEPRKHAISERTLRRPHERKEESREPTEQRDDHACTRNPAGVPAAGGGRGRSTARCPEMHPSRLEGPEYQPIATRWTHKRKAATAQEGQQNQAQKGSPKRRIAVKQETVRVNIGYLRVVDELEPTHSPRTLGIDESSWPKPPALNEMVFLHEIQHQQMKPGARNRATWVTRRQTQNAGKSTEARATWGNCSKFKIQNSKIPSEFFKIQISKQNSRLRDGYVGTRQRAQLLRTTWMLLSTRATVEITPKQSGWTTRNQHWNSIEFSWHSQSDETRINDRGQITKEVLLPNHTLGPPQHRTALLTKLYFPLFQLLRPSFAASHQSKPRILDKTCSKLRTQFLLRCLQVWSREPTPVLFMISHHSAFRHRIAACPGWEGSFRATCPAHPYTAASALCHRDGRFNLHLNACAERFVARNQSTHGTSWALRPPSIQRSHLVSWMETKLLCFCRRNPATRNPQDTWSHRGVKRFDTFFLRNSGTTQHWTQLAEHLPPLAQATLNLRLRGARSIQIATEHHQNLHPWEFHSFIQGNTGGLFFCRFNSARFPGCFGWNADLSSKDIRNFLRSFHNINDGAGNKEDVVGPHQNFKRHPFWSQDTAGARPAHICSNSSTNTAMTWFQPEGVLGPPCLMPTSKLNEALFVNPKHGRARSSKFSLTAAAAEMVVAPLSRSTSPNTWALTESNALATSMETTNNFSPYSSALRKLSTKKETMSRHCMPGLNPTSWLGRGLSSLSKTFHMHISYTLYSVGTKEISAASWTTLKCRLSLEPSRCRTPPNP